MPPSASEEQERLQTQKKTEKKRVLKSHKHIEADSDEEEFIPKNLALSTFDQILLNATESEKKKIKGSMNLRAVRGDNYLFAPMK